VELRQLHTQEEILAVYEIYRACMWAPTPEKYRQKTETLLQEKHAGFFALCEGERICGVTAVIFGEEGRAEIAGIAVAQEMRRRGVGSEMLRELRAAYDLQEICAETDGEAVEFYRQNGFEIQAHTEMYGGRECVRYLCRWRKRPEPV